MTRHFDDLLPNSQSFTPTTVMPLRRATTACVSSWASTDASSRQAVARISVAQAWRRHTRRARCRPRGTIRRLRADRARADRVSGRVARRRSLDGLHRLVSVDRSTGEETWILTRQSLDGLLVADVMTAHPHTVPGSISVEKFISDYPLGVASDLIPPSRRDVSGHTSPTIDQAKPGRPRTLPLTRSRPRLSPTKVPVR
jgi:hypothetical protein